MGIQLLMAHQQFLLSWLQYQQALLVASILIQLFQMRMVQRLKMQLSINLVTLWIQMLIAIPILFGIFKTGKVRQIKVALPIAMVAIM